VTQKTLKAPITFQGVGIHSGENCRLELTPAPPNYGCVFQVDGQCFEARVESVVRCDRSTCLGQAGVELSTVEHLLAAFSSLGVSNVSIRAQGHEVPVLDGSSRDFLRSLQNVGVVAQAANRVPYVLRHPIWVGDEKAGILALPAATATLEYALDYPHPMIGYQHCSFVPESDSFELELAEARTFALSEEVEVLLARGLARGGAIDNALVVYPDRWSSPLRYPDELVRHKMLDLIGDLYLLGRPLQARVIAVKAGHRLHVELVRKIRQEEEMHVG
jgi:UDP-3-O-acyl N-acetylglucosamine deacetylase